MTVVEYLMNHIFTEIRPSSVHGVGTFACRDINKGEKIFKTWDGETKIYELDRKLFKLLPDYVQKLILKDIDDNPKLNIVKFRLYSDSYFNLTNPLAFCNTKESDGNIDSLTSIVKKDIKKGEEIFGNYKLKNLDN